MTRRYSIARWISRIGHPFVLPLVALLVVTLRVLPPRQAIGTVAIIIVTTTIPIVLYTRQQVRSQRWSDYDVSVRQDRYRLYPLTLAVLATCGVLFWLLDAPAFVLRGIVATGALAFGAMLANLVLKISLHTALAIFCALVILALDLRWGILACAFAIMIGWSRLVLRRHSVLEVVCGAALGGVVGCALVLANQY